MKIIEAFGGIAETIAQLNPKEVVRIKAPEEMNNRVSELIAKKKESGLTIDENAELERFLTLDLFMSLTKARARLLLNS